MLKPQPITEFASALPKEIDMDRLLGDLYHADVQTWANDALEAIKALTGIRRTYLIDWKENRSNLAQAIIDVVRTKGGIHSWGRILRISPHANDGLRGNLSEFESATELMRYLATEAMIGDVTDKVDILLAEGQDLWKRIRAEELRDAGWTDSEEHGDSWLTDKGVFVGPLEDAYEAWVKGSAMATCPTCGGTGGDEDRVCSMCLGSGEVEVAV